MNKRLICLILSLLMLLSGCLAGCSQKTTDEAIDDTNEEASKSTITLAMYLVSENEVSEEQATAIQDAVNKITKSKFKTRLMLYFFTEDQYYTALEDAFVAHDNAEQAKKAAQESLKQAIKDGLVTVATTAKDAEESTEEETFLNEYGIPELKYPTIEDHQVDIFYLSGYDRLMGYINDNRVSRLDEELSGSSKILSSYLASNLLTYVKSVSGGATYAIPNNKAIGEYTYLLLNKEILKDYDYIIDGVTPDINKYFTSLTSDSTQELLENVSKYNKDYVPLHSSTGELDVSSIKYFGVGEDGQPSNAFSVLGGAYDNSWKYLSVGSYSPCENIFNSKEFVEQARTLISYKESGYYGTEEDADKPFAVGYVKGGAELAEIYSEDYEMVVVQKPVLDSYDIFEDMFAVSGYTSSVSRSMEIISYLNTNTDFRNLLLYGIEGENYELVDTDVKDNSGNECKVVRRLNESYMMDINKTGNVFIATPLEGQYPNINDYYKQQNLAAGRAYTLGFTYDAGGSQLNKKMMEHVRELSETLYAELMACNTVAEFDTFLGTAKTTVSSDEIVSVAKNSGYTKDSSSYDEEKYGEGVSFAAVYNEWLTKNKMIPEADESEE